MRTPLWQQRLKAHDLQQVAKRFGSFPIMLETYREVLSDVFEVPRLKQLLQAIASGQVRLVEVESSQPSPFASSLLFDYIASYMYEGDAPAAERRMQTLTLDRALLAELLAADDLRELLDAEAIAEVEAELQGIGGHLTADTAHDLLRRVGALTRAELDRRGADEAAVAAAREGSAGVRGGDGGGAASDRRRRRRALPRRPRCGAAAGRADGLSRSRARCTRPAGAAPRPHPRPVHVR